MTAPVPVSAQFVTADGRLGLHRSAIPRVVVENVVNSTGDGPFGQQWPNEVVPSTTPVNQNLKTMIDQRAHWKNDYGVAVQVQVEIQRSRRTMYTSAPNYAFIRERYTQAIGYDTPSTILAPDPNPATVWNTEWGGGIDVGVHNPGSGFIPNYGQFRLSLPESSLTLPLRRLEVNQAIDIRFRAALITPFRWWDNIPAGNRAFEMYAFSNTIRITAFPEPITP